MPDSYVYPEWISISAAAKRKLVRLAERLETDVDDIVNRMLDIAEDEIACGGNTPSGLSSVESPRSYGATALAWRPTDGE